MKRMSRVLRVGLVLTWCGAAMAQEAAAKAGSATSQPAGLKIEGAEYDFGKAWAGDAVSHTFKLTNTGSAPLAIKNVTAACGCTVVKDYAKSIAPGATWELPATLNTKGQSGRVTKPITVFFANTTPLSPEAKQSPSPRPSPSKGEGVQESIRLAFTGEVRVRYTAEPFGSFQFGRTKGQAVDTRTVTVTNQLDTPLELRNARADSETFFVDLREIEKGKRYEVAVATVPPLKEGMLRGKVLLDTNLKEQPTIELPISGFIAPRLGLTPGFITLPTSRPSDSQSTVTVRNDGNTPVHVKEVRASDPAIKTETKTIFEGKLYQISVTVPKDLAIPPAGYTLTVVTDDAEKPSLQLPIRKAGSSGTAGTSTVRPPHALLGKKAPEFKLATLAGKPLSNKALAGTITVLNFVSPSCGFCKKQMPRVEPIRATYEAKGIRFVNVAEKMGSKVYPPDEIASMFKQLGVGAELAVETDNAVGRSFGATSYPTMVIVGKTGTIEAVNSGNTADLETKLKTQFDALLAGRSLSQTASVKKEPNGRS